MLACQLHSGLRPHASVHRWNQSSVSCKEAIPPIPSVLCFTATGLCLNQKTLLPMFCRRTHRVTGQIRVSPSCYAVVCVETDCVGSPQSAPHGWVVCHDGEGGPIGLLAKLGSLLRTKVA